MKEPIEKSTNNVRFPVIENIVDPGENDELTRFIVNAGEEEREILHRHGHMRSIAPLGLSSLAKRQYGSNVLDNLEITSDIGLHV